MKSVVKVTKAGSITIPVYFRRKEGIQPGDVLNMDANGGEIRFTKYLDECVFCGSTKDLESYNGKSICKKCKGGLTR